MLVTKKALSVVATHLFSDGGEGGGQQSKLGIN